MLEYSIREYQRKDHAGLLACVRGFYGDGYPYPEFLDADILDRKIAAGDLILTVAVLPSDEVIAIVAAERQHGAFENTVVLKLRNIRREYRMNGVASHQLDDLLRRISEKFGDAACLYADVMTHNAVSQSSLVHRGYTLTGFRFMIYTASIMVPNLTYPPHTKMSQAVYCIKNGDRKVSVTAPEEHRERIADVYQKLGVPCTFVPAAPITRPVSDLTVCENERFAKTELIIRSAGTDLSDRVSAYLQTKANTEDFTAIAYLNLCDSGAVEAYRQFRSLGFYFTGLLPLTDAGEYMMLGKTDGCNQAYDLIAVEESNADWIPYILHSKNKNI